LVSEIPAGDGKNDKLFLQCRCFLKQTQDVNFRQLCSGDGDVMMRVLPSLLAVEAMRRGAQPREAAREVKLMVTVQYSI
jgi:hypothetical protein